MRRHNLLNNFILLLLFFTLAFSGGSKAAFAGKDKPEVYNQAMIDKLQLVADIIENYYVTQPDPKIIYQSTLKGTLNNLDSSSEYLSSFEYEQLEIEAQGSFVGIGIVLNKKGVYPEIIKVLRGSPAERAGLQAKDLIVTVDNADIYGLQLQSVVRMLQGEPLSVVRLKIRRAGSEFFEEEMYLTREEVVQKSLGSVFETEDGIGYIQCNDFSEHTPDEIYSTLARMISSGIRGLILDLRGNAGGVFESGIETAKLFLEADKVVVFTEGRLVDDNQTYTTTEKGIFSDLPLMIFVDADTASASEILAGSLKDNRRALLVGEKTFGKASIQSVFPLKDGSALRLTTAYYLTPDRQQIQGRGIDPNIELKSIVEFEKDLNAEELQSDTFVQTALKYFRESFLNAA